MVLTLPCGGQIKESWPKPGEPHLMVAVGVFPSSEIVKRLCRRWSSYVDGRGEGYGDSVMTVYPTNSTLKRKLLREIVGGR